ncbi:hypothetical protein G6F27_012878 [Rhizopus arrhizus]|nr:hypothetical protein G6F27_012878 [Rhizopus arrhizus]
MSDSYSNLINNNNVDPHATFTLSEEQQEALYQQFAIRYQAEHPSQDSSRKNEAIELPNEIWDELKSSSRNELHNNAKRFIRDTQRYIAGDWTKTPVINRPFVADLRRFQVEAKQVITSRYEDSDKLKIVGRSAAEIFEGLNAFTESGDEETFLQIMEKVRRLSIFSFASSQEIDREAKELTLAALRLPQHARHLEDQHVEDENKTMVFSPEDVEKIHQARYEHSILRNATSNHPREDEVLEVVSPKSLFLEEAEEGDFPTQPRCQTTTLTKTNSHQPTTAPTTNEVGSSLHYAGRWNTTGGEIATVLSTMEEDGESPVAIVCNRGGLSTSISSATFSLEDKTNETIASRSRGSILSSGKILEGRNHRNLTNSKRGLFVQLLHNPGTNKEAPDSRLFPTEPIFAISTLQDGRGTSLETDHREGRFDVQTRPQRCICGSADTSHIPTIFDIQAPK